MPQGQAKDNPNNPSPLINDVCGEMGVDMGREKEDEITNGFQNEEYQLSLGMGIEGGTGKDEEEEDVLVKEKAPGRDRKGRQRSEVG